MGASRSRWPRAPCACLPERVLARSPARRLARARALRRLCAGVRARARSGKARLASGRPQRDAHGDRMYAGHFDFTRPMLHVIEQLYTPAECAALLAATVHADWLPATINRPNGRGVDTRIRDNLTAIVSDAALPQTVFTRIAPHVPATMTSGWDGPRRAMRLHTV